MDIKIINSIIKQFLNETVGFICGTQESPDRFFYLLQGENKKYLLIKNDYFDLPKYEEKLFEAIGVRIVKWILPKINNEIISVFDGEKFVDINRYYIFDEDTYWKYALAEVEDIKKQHELH